MSNHFTKPFNPINWPAVPHDFTGDNVLGIYAKEKTQRFVYGTRYITWDGRVYKYMLLTTGGCVSYHGVAGVTVSPLTWSSNAVKKSAGERTIEITQTSASEDQYAGAMIEAYNATIDNSTQHHIIGNDAPGDTLTRLYLEFPLPVDLDNTDAFELFANQYAAVSETTHTYRVWLGVPCVTALTEYSIWAQTWGQALVSPGNTSLDTPAANERTAYWKPNAVVSDADDGEVTAGDNQVAGYIWNAGTSGIAGPQIYLMCST